MKTTTERRTIPLTTAEDETASLVASMMAQIPLRVVAVEVDGKRHLHDSQKVILPGQRARAVLPPEATKESIVVFHVERADGDRRLAMPALAEKIAHPPRLAKLFVYPGHEMRFMWEPDFVGRVVGVRARVFPSCPVCAGAGDLGVQKRIVCPECKGERGRVGGELRVQATGMFVGVDLQALSVGAIPLESLSGAPIETTTFMPGLAVSLGVKNDSVVPARVEIELECETVDVAAPQTIEDRPS
jgi:hypothetical protein